MLSIYLPFWHNIGSVYENSVNCEFFVTVKIVLLKQIVV